MGWRDECLKAGIREAEFWDMTVGEAVRAYEAHQEHRKDMAYFAFTEAMAVGGFVASMFGKHQPPTIHDIYPELFPVDEEAEEETRMKRSETNFINFANAFNKRYENGNGKSESENNG